MTESCRVSIISTGLLAEERHPNCCIAAGTEVCSLSSVHSLPTKESPQQGLPVRRTAGRPALAAPGAPAQCRPTHRHTDTTGHRPCIQKQPNHLCRRYTSYPCRLPGHDATFLLGWKYMDESTGRCDAHSVHSFNTLDAPKHGSSATDHCLALCAQP